MFDELAGRLGSQYHEIPLWFRDGVDVARDEWGRIERGRADYQRREMERKKGLEDGRGVRSRR